MGLTLLTSAIHFLDNAFRLDLYPGPAWLTRNIVMLAWLVLPAFALLAWRSGSRLALVAYGLLGFAGLGHYWAAHHSSMTGAALHGAMPVRCAVTIWGEAVASVVLLGYVLVWRE